MTVYCFALWTNLTIGLRRRLLLALLARPQFIGLAFPAVGRRLSRLSLVAAVAPHANPYVLENAFRGCW